MKATGIVRKVDELGRVVLPIELRRGIAVDHGDALEIGVNANEIILKKYVPRCVFCQESDNVKEQLGKNICASCLKDINTL
ncbi:AbrB/MazE/SpoVT family DNA-binding domain-containing protein [Ruminiclostridium josui]|uniref:AbrB/MazE/SpoVT family DNA-binding domain-containing protein n=1 Tax=Ruminiclostridium josui TaxID=1499 RepID=UPI000466E0EA|nr:AbrB/MazE/SpoVT family DNA-binding domain-containing protein [Ruminiclostridium josui]